MAMEKIDFLLSKRVKDQLRQIAYEDGISLSALMRQGLVWFLDKEEKNIAKKRRKKV